ncbi:MAG TPA: hypothetical protein VKX16_04915, partial [Chloroflexota bacterium]|nr:hypothetical protein [Chloroflexota bacterium]
MKRGRTTLSMVLVAGLIATWLAGTGVPLVGPALIPADAATCTINWTGNGGDGQWQNTANWDQGRVPNSTDYACIASGNVTFTTSDSVLGVNESGGTLTFNSGTLTLTSTTDASSFNAINVAGGGITVGTGATLNFPSGNTLSLSGSGTTLLNNGTVNWTAGTFCVNNGALLENAAQFNVGNNLTMEGCSGNGTFQNDAGAMIERNGGS